MGYTTKFEGRFSIVPALTAEDRSAYQEILDAEVGSRPNGAPDAYLQWELVPGSNDALRWDGGEKSYEYTEWLAWLAKNFFVPRGYALRGEVAYQGEDSSDRGVLYVAGLRVEKVPDVVVNPGPSWDRRNRAPQ